MINPLKSPLEERLKSWHGELWHTAKGRMIRDVVYAIDTGLVTTVSFLAGASVSFAAREKVIVAGLIQAVSGTLAIFFGSYISTKAQKHFFENQIERERKEIEDDPLKETLEIREIFADMGFDAGEQEIAVRRITRNKDVWLKFMAQEEIGIVPGSIDNPFEIAFISAASFILGAVPAILPFFLFSDVSRALSISVFFVLSFLFLLGIVKSRITKAHWLSSGVETLFFGSLSCAAGFFLGKIVSGYFH